MKEGMFYAKKEFTLDGKLNEIAMKIGGILGEEVMIVPLNPSIPAYQRATYGLKPKSSKYCAATIVYDPNARNVDREGLVVTAHTCPNEQQIFETICDILGLSDQLS